MDWISVKERKKPKQEQLVLCYVPECKIIGSILVGQFFKKENGFKPAWTVYDFNDSKLDANVTHWMSLPEKPNS